MRRLISEQEPESLGYLDTSGGLSSEYAITSAIIHVSSQKLKADLVKVAVQRDLSQGFRAAAVQMLEYSEAAKLDLPEFGEQFVFEQYDKAIEEGDYNAAHMMAGTMLRKGRIAVKTQTAGVDANDKGIESWRGKEEKAFGLYVRQILDAYNEGFIKSDDWRIRLLFDAYRFRQDGYDGTYVSPLAQEVAKANVEAALRSGLEWVALQVAVTAKLPDDYVSELRKKVAPNAVDKVEKWANELKDRISRVLTNRQ